MSRNSEELNSDAKELIRSYMIKIVLIPGALISLISAIGGYAISESSKVSAANAYAESIKDASNKIHDLTITTAKASQRATSASNEVQKLNQDASLLFDKISKNEQITASINDQGAIAGLVEDSLLKNPEFTHLAW